MAPTFDPANNAADLVAVFVDTAPLDARYNFAEATALVYRVKVLRAFVPAASLAVAVEAAKAINPLTLA